MRCYPSPEQWRCRAVATGTGLRPGILVTRVLGTRLLLLGLLILGLHFAQTGTAHRTKEGLQREGKPRPATISSASWRMGRADLPLSCEASR